MDQLRWGLFSSVQGALASSGRPVSGTLSSPGTPGLPEFQAVLNPSLVLLSDPCPAPRPAFPGSLPESLTLPTHPGSRPLPAATWRQGCLLSPVLPLSGQGTA